MPYYLLYFWESPKEGLTCANKSVHSSQARLSPLPPHQSPRDAKPWPAVTEGKDDTHPSAMGDPLRWAWEQYRPALLLFGVLRGITAIFYPHPFISINQKWIPQSGQEKRFEWQPSAYTQNVLSKAWLHQSQPHHYQCPFPKRFLSTLKRQTSRKPISQLPDIHSFHKCLLHAYYAPKITESQLPKAFIFFKPYTNPRCINSFQNARVCPQPLVTTGVYFQLYHHLHACNINHSTLAHLFSKEEPRSPQA